VSSDGWTSGLKPILDEIIFDQNQYP
jgi:hypothetical protein